MSETTRIDAKKEPAKRTDSSGCAGSAPLRESPQSPVSKITAIQRTAGNVAVQRMLKAGKIESRKNETGLPDRLKGGVERLSGMDLSEVRVHYNSEKPAGIGALAYTRGTDIHVAPGQEAHLPHEAWHVVQQAQGRVRPTFQLKDAGVNADVGLEAEADTMGKRALQMSRDPAGDPDTGICQSQPVFGYSLPTIVQRQGSIIQAVWIKTDALGVLKWNVPISGVRWYTKGELYWFVIESKEGEQFSGFDGIEKGRTHEQWKELGAKDLPEGDTHYAAMYNMMPRERQELSNREWSPVEEESPISWVGPTMTKKTGPKEHPIISPLGPSKNLPFYQWLYQNKENPKQMNCYEAVLYAAVLSGIKTKEYIKEMITMVKGEGTNLILGLKKTQGFQGINVNELIELSVKEKPKKDAKLNLIQTNLPLLIPRGYVVFFGEQGQHVALSEGKTDQKGHWVLELDRFTNGVKQSTIEEIVTQGSAYDGYVGWGPLP